MLFKGNSSTLQNIIDRLQSNQEHKIQIDTLGTERESSCASEERTISPSSSCPTPNSSADGCELFYTVGITDGTPHKCRFCEKAFAKLSYLKKHEQSHTNYLPFQCIYCERYFKHKRSRDRHIKLHTGDKKYKCDQCDSAFSRSDHLKIHMKTHDTLKPYQCTVCNRGYNTAAALTSHLQNHRKNDENHPPSVQPDNTFKCLKCSTLFSRPKDLKLHIVNHPSCGDSRGSRGKSKSSVFPSTHSSTCFLCFREFSSAEAMGAHVQSAHKSFYNAYHLRGKISALVSPASHLFGSNGATGHRSNHSSFSSGTPTGNFYCELCAMHFPTVQNHQKHMIEAHNIKLPSRILHFAAAAAAGSSIPALFNGEAALPPYCVICSLHFPTVAVLAEHCIVAHARGSYSPHLLSVEQTMPTDLTVGRRGSPKKISSSEELAEGNSPKKHKKTSNKLSNGNGTVINYDLEVHHCPQCDEKFVESESLKTHIEWHLEMKSFDFNLDVIGDSMNTEIKNIGEQYRCSVCVVATFSNEEALKRHRLTHFVCAIVAHRCQHCHKSFNSPNELQTHMAVTHLKKLYSCSVCREVFESRNDIDAHFEDKHKNETEIFRCLGCPNSSVIYHSENEIVKHVKMEHISASFTKVKMPGDTAVKEENFQNFSPERKVNLLSPHYENKTITNGFCDSNNVNGVYEERQTACHIRNRQNFTDEKKLQSRMKRKHITKHASPNKINLYCVYCNENCKSYAELALHVKSHSPFTQEPIGQSSICKELCTSPIVSSNHKLTHYKMIFNNEQNTNIPRLQTANHPLSENRIPLSSFLNTRNYFYGTELPKQLASYGYFPPPISNNTNPEQILNRFYKYNCISNETTAADGDNESCSSPNVNAGDALNSSTSINSKSYNNQTDSGLVRSAVKMDLETDDYANESEDEQIDVVDTTIEENNRRLDKKF